MGVLEDGAAAKKSDEPKKMATTSTSCVKAFSMAFMFLLDLKHKVKMRNKVTYISFVPNLKPP
jgi:hypothetical protein